MNSYCEHYLDTASEDFFFDDENSNVRLCVNCRKRGKFLSNGFTDNSRISYNSNLNIINDGMMDSDIDHRLLISDDPTDHLEDSPLLINDNFGEALSQFHCHDDLTIRNDRKAWKKLVSASVLCVVFMIAEVVGGYFAGSLAVMTDAAHLLSDLVGFNISLIAIWVGKKSPTKFMTFGYYRAEVLGALLSVITVWLLAVVFCILAAHRLITKDYDIEPDTMIIVASLGLAINLGMAGVLHGVCHTHSHGGAPPKQTHSHTSNDNINVRAAAAHVIGDILQSVGVLLAAIIIKFCPNAEIADPICTLLFAILVLFTTFRVAKDSIWFLLEGSPINSAEIAGKLKSLTNVKHIHSLHVWSLSPGKEAVAVHLAVDKYCDRDLVLKQASALLKSQISIMSCTIQVESYNSELISRCTKCQMIEC